MPSPAQGGFRPARPRGGRRLAAHGLDFLSPRPGITVSGFAAIRDEIDPAALLDWLHREGFKLALPVMEGRGKPLILRAWAPGDEMSTVQWGIREPLASKAELYPDVVLVPLLAFDRGATGWVMAAVSMIAHCRSCARARP